MRSISRRAWNTVLFASLSWLAAGEASARIIYKCEDPIHGKTRFSKDRCAPLEKQQVLPPLLGGDQHPDVLALCTATARKEPHRNTACMFMLECLGGDRSNCGVYCWEQFQPYFPEVAMGPTSPVCLAVAGLKRGANWVQSTDPRPLDSDTRYDSYIFRCLDPRDAMFPGAEMVYCKRGTAECARQVHELPKPQPPEQLAAAVCQEKYGTRIAPRTANRPRMDRNSVR